MTAPFLLGTGIEVTLEVPVLPTFVVTPPDLSSTVLVLPVAGPPGPPGGEVDLTAIEDDVAALQASVGVLQAEPRGYVHYQNASATLVQIVHGLPFRPAGVRCTDTQGNPTWPQHISDPAPGITEVTFGAPFIGEIDLS